MLGGINLSNVSGWVHGGKLGSGLHVLWGELLAVTTPWGVEFDEQVLVVGKGSVKVVSSKHDDSLIHLWLEGPHA